MGCHKDILSKGQKTREGDWGAPPPHGRKGVIDGLKQNCLKKRTKEEADIIMAY